MTVSETIDDLDGDDGDNDRVIERVDVCVVVCIVEVRVGGSMWL